MDDRTITIPVANDDDGEEGEEAFRVTLANPGGGAALEGSTSIDVTIDDGATVGPPPGGGGGGGGLALELLALLAIWFLVAQAQQQAHRRAHDRAVQVRLRNHRDA